MQLYGVSAQNFRLRETEAGVAHLVHAGLKVRDVLFQTHVRRRDIEPPGVNSAGNVVKAAANVDGQLAQLRLQPLRVGVVMAVFDGELEGHERIKK